MLRTKKRNFNFLKKSEKLGTTELEGEEQAKESLE